MWVVRDYPHLMPIYALGELVPQIDRSAYIHPDAVIIGSVIIGPESSVWPTAVLRADTGVLTIGARTNIQDGAVIHTHSKHVTTIGDDVVVAHNVHIEGAVIGNSSLIGSGSTVLQGSTIGFNALVGAQALVPPNTEVPDYAKALGVPAKIILDSVEPGFGSPNAKFYVAAGKKYSQELRKIED